ncbi:MAG: hypothetical protein HOV81_02655 [Kofleriaceae bacterium]|nr:hypothetical protein [Kofleriaceae bacterium]
MHAKSWVGLAVLILFAGAWSHACTHDSTDAPQPVSTATLRRWSKPVRLAPRSAKPLVAAPTSGQAVVLWHDPWAHELVARRYARRWLEAQKLPLDARGARDLHLMTSARGDVIALWWRQTQTGGEILAARLTGTWQAPQVVWSSAHGQPRAIATAMNGAGAGALVFQTREASSTTIWLLRLDPTAGWQAPEAVTDPADWGEQPAVAVDASGAIDVAWLSTMQPKPGLWTRERTRAGWQTPVRLGSDRSTTRVDIAVGPEGSAVVLATIGDGLWAAWRSKGAWSAPAEVDPDTPNEPVLTDTECLPQVAFDGSGGAVVLWEELVERRGRRPNLQVVVRAATGRAGQPWRASVLDTGDDYANAALAVGANGSAAVLFLHVTPIARRLLLSTLGAGGWQTERTEFVGRAPALAVDPKGGLTMLWMKVEGSDTGLWARRSR